MQNVFPTPPRRYLTLTIKPQKNLIERTDLIELIFAFFEVGKRWIVLYGNDGIGKTTLANTFFHEADQRDTYPQFGWVDYSLNLSKSIVKAFISEREVPEGAQKNDAFYDMVAREEVLKLRNADCPLLLVFDGVHSEQEVLERLDLIEIKKAHVLITAPKRFEDKRFHNITLPPLRDESVLSFFQMMDVERQILGKAELDSIRENLWLLRLLTVNTPKVSEKDAKDFLGKVLASIKSAQADKSLHQHIAQAVFETKPLSAAECWVLLQMAALPEGSYDLETFATYLAEPGVEDADVADLRGYAHLEEVWPHDVESPDTRLSTLLPVLVEKGWLIEQEGEYSLYSMAAQVLRDCLLNDYAFFPEIANCLSVSYFSAQTNYLKDNLHYENHLLRFLNFVAEDSDEAYLNTLWKLVTYYNDTVDWRKELQHRLQHLRCAEAVAGKEKRVGLLRDISDNYERLGLYAEAREYGQNALDLAWSFLSESDPTIAYCQSNLGQVCQKLGEYARARDLFEAALASGLKNFGPENPTVAAYQSNLGWVYQELGDYARARDLLEAALASDLKNFDAEHPTIAINQSELGWVYQELGDYARARGLIEAALTSGLKNFGPEHPYVADYQSNLGWLYKQQGDYARARDLLEAALTSSLKNFGTENPRVAIVQNNLANVYRELGDYARARDLLETTLASDLKNLGTEHLYTAISKSNLGRVYGHLGEYAHGRVLIQSAIASELKSLHAEHPRIAAGYNHLAHVFLLEGNYPEAIVQFEEALSIVEKSLGREHPKYKEYADGLEKARRAAAGAQAGGF